MKSTTNEVKSFVDQNLKDVKTVNSVSRGMHEPYDHLRKQFLREEGLPLGRYITRQKVRAMQEMLTVTDYPCFFVCYEMGYREDTGAKVFKKLTGMTMLEYKRWSREQQHRSAAAYHSMTVH